MSVALLIVGSIVIIASAVLWFAVALHIGLQSGKKISIGIYVKIFPCVLAIIIIVVQLVDTRARAHS